MNSPLLDDGELRDTICKKDKSDQVPRGAFMRIFYFESEMGFCGNLNARDQLLRKRFSRRNFSAPVSSAICLIKRPRVSTLGTSVRPEATS